MANLRGSLQNVFFKNEKVLAIGDNLRTDIKGANVLNFDCVYISEGFRMNIMMTQNWKPF